MKAKDGTQILLSKFTISEANNLSIYLNHLSPESKQRFGPHPYDVDSIYTLFNQSDTYVGYIAQEKTQGKIISYSVIKHGYLEHDKLRLESYGLELDKDSDCTFAPSVSDEYQNKGIGKLMFDYIIDDLQTINKKRIILWGVRCTSGQSSSKTTEMHTHLSIEGIKMITSSLDNLYYFT